MKVIDILNKLKVNYKWDTTEQMRKDVKNGPDQGLGDQADGVLAYYSAGDDEMHIPHGPEGYDNNPPDPVGQPWSDFKGRWNYMVLHELTHWGYEKFMNSIDLWIKRIICPPCERAMEEVGAESGAEVLEKDLMHEDEAWFAAQRINMTADAFHMPTHAMDEAIKEGIDTAHYIEERLEKANERA